MTPFGNIEAFIGQHPSLGIYQMKRLANSKGFTLTELAVVLFIVALLIGGMMLPLVAQQEIRRTHETQNALAEARDALLGFAVAQGRLPCPASPTIPTGTAGAGLEDCTLTEGAFPWASMGMQELDPWGRRFTYRVTSSFMDQIPANTVTPPLACTVIPTQASFALCSEGDMTVTDGSVTIATTVPVVLLSHGVNGRGAYLPNGSQLAGAANDELENANNNATFVSRIPSPEGTANEFDDLVIWLSPNILFNRMVAAGKLP